MREESQNRKRTQVRRKAKIKKRAQIRKMNQSAMYTPDTGNYAYKKARRRRRRKRVVVLQRAFIAATLLLFIGGGTYFWWINRTDVKLEKQIQAGNNYAETEDYDGAIASYQAALEIDSTSVKAYRAMAGTYLTIEDEESAVQVLYQGWENTQDESLLQYYCTVLLNEAVAEINDHAVTMTTVIKCIEVLEMDHVNTDAYERLAVCYERLFGEETQTEENRYFCHTDVAGCTEDCSFYQYEALMDRMLALYEKAPEAELKNIIHSYGLINHAEIRLDMAHIQDYLDLLKRITAVTESSQVSDLIACLEKAIWAQEIFAPAFAIFDGAAVTGEPAEFAAIKDFMNTPEYIALRDEFMAGTMEYWSGQTYIPVSREQIKIIRSEDGYRFSFLSFGEFPQTKGVINIWGTKQEDAGVQRVAISYEPAAKESQAHITYEIFYLYSNVLINGAYVPKMNYRFETKTATAEGLFTDLIGDWGGDNEWQQSY